MCRALQDLKIAYQKQLWQLGQITTHAPSRCERVVILKSCENLFLSSGVSRRGSLDLLLPVFNYPMKMK